MANKILYLVTQSEWGGAQKYIFDLAKTLKNQSEIIVAAGEGTGELLKRCENENIKTHQLKFLKRSINPLFDIVALFELIFLIKKERPDIIHLNSSKISILGSLAGKFNILIFGLKSLIIYTVHGWVFNEPLPKLQKKIYFILEKLTAKIKDKIICVSNYDKKIALERQIAPENKLTAIHNGLNFENLQFLDQRDAKDILFSLFAKNFGYKIQDTRYVIVGTIANLYKTKGINYLIEAAAQIIKQNPQIIFMVIGDGPERKNLERQIDQLCLRNNFYLFGKLEKAFLYLKAFNLYVSPSIKEGLPYVLLEALAAKLPIVATSVGGVPEIIQNGVNGLLVKPYDPDKLADDIIKILSSFELEQQLTLNTNLADFTLSEMVKKTKAVYEQ